VTPGLLAFFRLITFAFAFRFQPPPVNSPLPFAGTADELTGRCKEECVAKNVSHIGGDFLKLAPHLQANFDAIVSFNTFLHIPARLRLFHLVRTLLKPGGLVFAEDFYKRRFTAQHPSTLLLSFPLSFFLSRFYALLAV
jgi:SAM-dependent methyltransferase